MDDLELALKEMIAPCEEPVNKDELKKLGPADMLLSQVPGVISASALSKAYKVVMPTLEPGTKVKLMQLKNSLKSTTLVDESGRIVGQAGLKSLSDLASPMLIFSAMSVITGQYFMAEINSSLEELTSGINSMQRRLDASEEGTVFSYGIFLQEIKNDWLVILDSDEYRASVVTNAVKAVSELVSSCYYFQSMLVDKISNASFDDLWGKKGCFDELIAEIKRTAEFLKMSYELRFFFKVISFYLTMDFSQFKGEEIRNILRRDEKILFNSSVKNMVPCIDDFVEKLKTAPKINEQEKVKQIINVVSDIRAITKDQFSDSVIENVFGIVEKLQLFDFSDHLFYIVDNELYMAH